LNATKQAMGKHVPVVEVKFDRRKHKKSEWITAGLIKLINYRDKLYSRLRKTSRESENYEILRFNLRTITS